MILNRLIKVGDKDPLFITVKPFVQSPKIPRSVQLCYDIGQRL